MMDISNFIPVIRALVILIAGYFIARLLTSSILKVVGKHLSKQQQGLLRRILFYGLLVVVLISALHEMGFKLSVLLGAAGILSVAIGFASQTSASNLISGLFLLAERPFVVGDIIRVGSTTGEVLAIDLLSAKLRTFDNLYVRIPNETMLKSEVTTLTRFPIRRLDVAVGVAYKENTEQVREVLLAIAHQNPLCLDEPAPLFMFLGFGDSAQNLQLSVWVKRENFLEMKNTIHYEIKKALDAHGVEIPFPHVSLYAGSETKAFPVTVVGQGATE